MTEVNMSAEASDLQEIEDAGERKLWLSFLALAFGCLVIVGGAWIGAQKFGQYLTVQQEQQVAERWLQQSIRLFDRRENTFIDARATTPDMQTLFDLVRATDLVRIVLLDKHGKIFFSTDTRTIGKSMDLSEVHATLEKGHVARRHIAVDPIEFAMRSGMPNKASQLSTESGPSKDRLVLEFFVPVMADGNWVGSLVIDQDQTASIIAHGSMITKGAMVFCGVLLLLFASVSGLIYSYAGQRRKNVAALASARDDAIAAQDQLQQVNEDVIKLNRDLEHNVKQLRDAQDEIIRKGKMAQLGQLTATVAHDLRNPLGAVRTAAYLIERKTADSDLGIEKALERISNGITRCDGIITELLDFARSKELQLETLMLDEWVTNLLQEQAQRLPDVVSLQCHQGLDGLEVEFDPGKIRRALINLLSNASEAMVGKGDDPSAFTTQEPQIVVSTTHTARGAEIRVIDNGPGISPENLAKIMEPLFTTKSFGVGLGLPAVEKILEQHGGGLEIDSTEGAGTTMTAWFPVQQANRKAA